MELARVVHCAERILFPIARTMHKIGLAILFLLMLVTVGDVVGRYFLALPIPGTFELTNFMLALIVFLTLGFTQVQNGHISIDFFMSRFSLRTQAITESINYLLTLLLFCLVIWQTAVHAKRLWMGNNVSGILSWPIYPFVIFVALGSLIFSLVLFVNFLGAVAKAVEK